MLYLGHRTECEGVGSDRIALGGKRYTCLAVLQFQFCIRDDRAILVGYVDCQITCYGLSVQNQTAGDAKEKP